MAVINTLTSLSQSGNTGVPAPALHPGLIKGAILIDPSFSLTPSEILTIETTLAAATLVVGTGRIFPISGFEEMKDASEEEQVQTLGYGSKTLGREGKYDWSFRITKGGIELLKNLRKFNDRDMSVLFWDENNKLYGWKDDSDNMKGFTLEFFYAKPWKVADGSNDTIYMIRFAMKEVSELNDDLAFVACDFDIANTIKGIIDVTLTEVSHTGTTAIVKVTTAFGAIDLGALFETNLEKAANWRLYPVAGGSDVVPSGIVYTAPTGTNTVGYFTITHSALTASHYLSLDTPAVLAADGMGGSPDNGYESNTITIAYTS